MKYKILKGTNLFTVLTDINKRMIAVKKQAKDLAIEFGGIKVATAGRHLAGGIDGIEFKEKPVGWRSVGNSWQNLYYPKMDKSMKVVRDKIDALPTIDFDEINKAVGFSANQVTANSNSLSWVKGVVMAWHKDFVLMETVEGTTYKPVPDVIEILGSEYDVLKKKIKD